MLRTSLTVLVVLVAFQADGFAQGHVISASSDEEFARLAGQHAVDQANMELETQRQMRAVSRMMKFFEQHENPASVLSLVDSQVEEIKKLKSDHESKIAELKDVSFEGMPHSEMMAAKKQRNREINEENKQFQTAVFDVLLEHQRDIVTSYDARNVGIAKAITESEVGEFLGLTKQQENKIRKESDRLAAKIHDFIHDARMESFETIIGELSTEQVEKLKSLYGDKFVTEYFESSDLKTMFKHLLYEPNRVVDEEVEIDEAIRKTDVWKK